MAYYHLLLALMMVATGSINTIVTKYADLLCGQGLPLDNNCTDVQKCIATTMDLSTFSNTTDAVYCSKSSYIQDLPEDKRDEALLKYRLFDHPFVQAFTMFVGEFMCLVVYHASQLCCGDDKKKKRKRNNETDALLQPDQPETPATDWPPYIWALPASCDACATTSMYVGLTLTHASDFQMLRGSVVIFTGLLSKFWLKRVLVGYHWAGMFLVLAGLVFVGITGFLEGSGGSGASNPILGDAIIIAAQVIVATQMVLEEKILTKYPDVPVLCAVGWEGFFGMFYMLILATLFTFFGGTSLPPWNAFDAIDQIYHNYEIGLVLLGTVCSIAFFNFSGLSVTKVMSATTRMVLDSIRTVVIWAFCVFATKPYDSKEPLQTLTQYTPFQVAGFVILLMGTFVYNEREVPGVFDANGKQKKETLVAPLLRKLGCMKAVSTEVPLGGFADNKGSVNRNVYE